MKHTGNSLCVCSGFVSTRLCRATTSPVRSSSRWGQSCPTPCSWSRQSWTLCLSPPPPHRVTAPRWSRGSKVRATRPWRCWSSTLSCCSSQWRGDWTPRPEHIVFLAEPETWTLWHSVALWTVHLLFCTEIFCELYLLSFYWVYVENVGYYALKEARVKKVALFFEDAIVCLFPLL